MKEDGEPAASAASAAEVELVGIFARLLAARKASWEVGGNFLRATGTVYAVAWQPTCQHVPSNSMYNALRKTALARRPTTTFCCKDSQLPRCFAGGARRGRSTERAAGGDGLLCPPVRALGDSYMTFLNRQAAQPWPNPRHRSSAADVTWPGSGDILLTMQLLLYLGSFVPACRPTPAQPGLQGSGCMA